MYCYTASWKLEEIGTWESKNKQTQQSSMVTCHSVWVLLSRKYLTDKICSTLRNIQKWTWFIFPTFSLPLSHTHMHNFSVDMGKTRVNGKHSLLIQFNAIKIAAIEEHKQHLTSFYFHAMTWRKGHTLSIFLQGKAAIEEIHLPLAPTTSSQINISPNVFFSMYVTARTCTCWLFFYNWRWYCTLPNHWHFPDNTKIHFGNYSKQRQ